MNRSVTNFFFDGEMFAKIDLEDSYVLTLWGTSQTYLSWAATYVELWQNGVLPLSNAN